MILAHKRRIKDPLDSSYITSRSQVSFQRDDRTSKLFFICDPSLKENVSWANVFMNIFFFNDSTYTYLFWVHVASGKMQEHFFSRCTVWSTVKSVKTELHINEHCSQQMEVHLKFSFTMWLTQHATDSLYTDHWTHEFASPLWWIFFFLLQSLPIFPSLPLIKTAHSCSPFLVVTVIYWSVEHSLAFCADGAPATSHPRDTFNACTYLLTFFFL